MRCCPATGAGGYLLDGGTSGGKLLAAIGAFLAVVLLIALIFLAINRLMAYFSDEETYLCYGYGCRTTRCCNACHREVAAGNAVAAAVLATFALGAAMLGAWRLLVAQPGERLAIAAVIVAAAVVAGLAAIQAAEAWQLGSMAFKMTLLAAAATPVALDRWGLGRRG